MFATFRRLAKSKIGTAVMVLFLVAILASFAMADINGLKGGGLGLSSGTLAKAGSEELTERDLSDLFGRALAQARQQHPEATPADLRGDFDPMVDQIIGERALAAFATDQKLLLSRRLIDAEIARIPGTRGLDGKFTEQSYRAWLSQQRMTDPLVRRLVASDMIQRLLSAPVAANARVPIGVATPYASMLLEQRSGEVSLVLVDAFKDGLNPSAGDLQAFYDQNKRRYMVPEQRILRMATMTAANLPSAAPSEAEIAAYYKAHGDKFGASQTRVLSQAVVQDQKVADGIAERARGGASFAAAAAPAGLSAADVSVGPQTQAQFSGLAGNAVAASTFATPAGSIIGPIKSDLGWHVVRVDSISGKPPVTLAAARGEIVAAITADKAKEALADLVSKVEDKIAGGASLPEAAAANKLTLTETPLIGADGVSRADPAYKADPALAPAIKSGFDLSAEDEPVVEEMPGGKGYVLVGVGRIVPAAPAPLAEIKDRVASDWKQRKAMVLAQASASAIAAKVAAGQSMASAVAAAGKGAIAPRPVTARRIDLAKADPNSVIALKLLFILGEGKSRMIADPQGRGFYVVKTDKIIPGNAGSQPALIAQVQQQFQQTIGDELAQQFATAVRQTVGVKRDDKAIAAAKARLTQTGN